MSTKVQSPQAARAGANGVLPWIAWLLGLAGVLASFYCFYNAKRIADQTADRENLVQQMQHRSVQLRTAWLQDASDESLKEPLAEFEQAYAEFNNSAAVARAEPVVDLSDNVSSAFDELNSALAESPLSQLMSDQSDAVQGSPAAVATETATVPNANPEASAGNGSLAEDLGLLVEASAALRVRLTEINAPAVQVEPAGHLYQLAVTLRKQLVLDAAVPGASGDVRSTRGPWLVFEQILQRIEAMLGTREITDENVVALTSELRAQQVKLGTVLAPVFAGNTSLESLSPASSGASGQAGNAALDSQSAEAMLESTLSATNEARQALSARHNLLDDSLDALNSAEASGRENQSLWFLLGLLSGLVGTAILSLLAIGLMRSLGKERQKHDVTNEKQEESILLLLDEISQLAEGDLRTQATVTDGITGSIADSVNYAVSELRRLVGTMSTSAERVQVAVEETGTTARQLANASVVQSREIGRSSAYTKAMADTMEQLSTRASEAKAIAAKSASLSVSARSSVEQTQDRVKAVKQKTADANRLMQRLGDSSNQISRSIKLIDQVAEKTRLLAMNTAIRVRSNGTAGGAGELASEMSEVAEQVRGLSNRLGQSAGEIETLVSVVRQDVAATLGSMNAIDSEVEAVSRQATEAGNSMMQIEAVSDRLKQIVDTIDARVERQSKVVKQLSSNMGVINDVTRHSAHGLQLSASSLEDLRLMSSELRDGVAEFALPEQDQRAIARRTEEIRNHVHVGAGSETMAVRADDLTEAAGAVSVTNVTLDTTRGEATRFDETSATSDYPAVTSRHHHDVTFFGKQGSEPANENSEPANADGDRYDDRTVAIQEEVSAAMGDERKHRGDRLSGASRSAGVSTLAVSAVPYSVNASVDADSAVIDHDRTVALDQTERTATPVNADLSQTAKPVNDESLVFDTVMDPGGENHDVEYDDTTSHEAESLSETVALPRSEKDKG